MILIYTGDGKGKTSAAMGNVFRAIGHGMKVLVIQFFKGDWPVVFGELESAKKHKNLEFLQMGKGFVRIMGDKKPFHVHKTAARTALETAGRKILSKKYDLVVLDEVIYALDRHKSSGMIALNDLLKLLKKTPSSTHVILTGRNAPKELIESADLVTEMIEVKHPFQKGTPARKGIDY
jgi:cob(I)alamin adenosyltransferase